MAKSDPESTSPQVHEQADTRLGLNSWGRAWSGAHPDPMHSARAGGVRGVNVV